MGLSVPDLWPFEPRIVARETLSFQTDVRQTPEGEMRESLRAARRIVDMEFDFDDAQGALAETMFRKSAAGDWLVPVWPELTQFPAIVAAGATVFTVNEPSDYTVGGQAFLLRHDQGYEAIEVASVGATTVTLDAVSTIDADAIAPVRTGYITGDLGGARWFKGHAVRQLQIEYRDGDDMAATPYDQYLEADLVTDPSVVASPVEARLISARSFIDNGFGAVAVEPLRDITDGMMQIVHRDFGHSDMVQRKRWFHYLRGRDKSFWLPTWTHDLTLADTIAFNQGFIDIAPLYGAPADLVGRHIVIDDGQGFLPRLIEAGAVNGADWRLTIEATGRDIDEARVMFLNRMRLDTDRIEMVLTGPHYMETSVAAVEVPE